MSVTPPRTIEAILEEQALQVPPEIEAASALPYHVAFVIDGVVQQVFHVEERLAAVLLSAPTIVQCDSPVNGGPDVSWAYDATTNTFTKP